MKYRIEEKKEFKVLALSMETSTEEGRNYKDIPEFWQKINSDGSMGKLWGASSDPTGMYGVCYDMKYDETFRYAAAVPFSGDESKGFEVIDIPASKWVIFESRGPMPAAIQEVWKQAFSEWLPESDYELAELPQLEYYTSGNPEAEDYLSEVWLPLQ